MMVGNGATRWDVDVEPSFPATVRWFNIIPAELLEKFDSNNCHYYFYPGYSDERQSLICDATWEKINLLAANLNWYDLYRPVYPDTLLSTQNDLKANRTGEAIVNGEVKTFRRGYTMSEYTPWAKHHKSSKEEPILGDYFTSYMNREDVREAFHIPTTV